jgi:hypothetical protein
MIPLYIKKGAGKVHSLGMVHFNKVYLKLFKINIEAFVW